MDRKHCPINAYKEKDRIQCSYVEGIKERNTTFALQMMQSTEIFTQKGVKVSLFFVPPVPNGNEIIP